MDQIRSLDDQIGGLKRSRVRLLKELQSRCEHEKVVAAEADFQLPDRRLCLICRFEEEETEFSSEFRALMTTPVAVVSRSQFYVLREAPWLSLSPLEPSEGDSPGA